MAPGTRRANRGGYVEHDDFEGLPVRQWRQEWTNVAPPAQPELQQQNDIWAIELLHGIPKDAVLLPPHTQELLRAARSGRLYKRPAPTDEDDGDGDAIQPDKLDKKEEDVMSQGYHIRLWKQIPKNVEAPVISHLAKRRKNTVTIASRTVEEKIQGPTVTRATVRRIDAAGNPYTEEVTLAEGQQPDGEVISTRVEALPAAKGPEALAPALPAARRRPPPPKRKAKAGPGRGKKKMARSLAAGAGRSAPAVLSGAGAPPVVKPESENSVNLSQIGTLTPVHDSEMADGDEDDEEDDGEDVDEGEDGDEGEAEGDETVELEQSDLTAVGTSTTPTKDQDHEMSGASFIAEAEAEVETDAAPEDASAELLASSSQSVLLAPHASAHSTVPLEGSPLKNVVLQSPIETPITLPPPVTAETAIKPEESVQVAMFDTSMSMDSVVDEPQVSLDIAPVQESEPGPADHEPQELQEPQEPQEPIIAEAPPTGSSIEEALLPPPPDQVGNISSPKTEDGAYKSSEDGVKSHASHELEEGDATGQPLTHLISAINEDVIDPEDSVSVAAHRPRSTGASDNGGTSLDEMKDNPLSIAEEMPVEGEQEHEPEQGLGQEPEPAPELELEPQPEPEPESEMKPEVEPEAEAVLALALDTTEATPPAAEEEPDLLGGLMGELDRQTGEAAPYPTPQEVEQITEPMDFDPPQVVESEQMPQSETPLQPETDVEPEDLPTAEPETATDSADAIVTDAEPEPTPLPTDVSAEDAAPVSDEVTAMLDEAPPKPEDMPDTA